MRSTNATSFQQDQDKADKVYEANKVEKVDPANDIGNGRLDLVGVVDDRIDQQVQHGYME